MLKFWRIWGALLGSLLMVGETIRSWGQGRNPLFVVDDFLVGIPLVVSAIVMAKPSPVRCCAFSASFAAAAGMLYGSFFEKLVDLSQPASSNIETRLLTALIGLAFGASLIGLAASLRIASKVRTAPAPAAPS